MSSRRLLRPVAVLVAVACGGLAIGDDLDGTTSSVIRAGDIDGDGIEDVLVLGRGTWRGQLVALRIPTFDVLWAIRDGGRTFGENIHDVGDFDGDGISDFTVGSTGPREQANVALISGADGHVILRKFGVHRAVLLSTHPSSWLVMRITGPTAYLLPTKPPTWQVVNDTSGPAVIRIDPRTDEVLACYSDAVNTDHNPNGWDAAGMTTHEGTFIALTCKEMVRICTVEGDVIQELRRPTELDQFGWSSTIPTPWAARSPAHLVISTHHRRCEVYDVRTWSTVSTISGCNVQGVMDAFASSLDAYYEPDATEPSVVVGAAEMWTQAFDEGYVTLARPGGMEPLVLLRNREIGFHACFIGDLDRDGAREVFAIAVSPTDELGRPRRATIDVYVLDGKNGREVRKGVLKFPYAELKHR